MSLLLGVNIDHVATLRQARYAGMLDSVNAEPSPLTAALEAKEGGADSITIHVREDRRHIQAEDAFEIREKCELPLNLEMGVTSGMIALARKLRPDFVCLVPEKREEVTTEGGLDVLSSRKEVGEAVANLQEEGIRVSLFVDPGEGQVQASKETGAEMIELHTGAYANAVGPAVEEELERLRKATAMGVQLGLQVNAGHGINYRNIEPVVGIPGLVELNIGHSIVSRSVVVGMRQAVSEMKAAMNPAAGS